METMKQKWICMRSKERLREEIHHGVLQTGKKSFLEGMAFDERYHSIVLYIQGRHIDSEIKDEFVYMHRSAHCKCKVMSSR